MSAFQPSQCLGNVRPSATIAVTSRARELRAAGEDVIGLGAGEPDFPTPEPVCEAAVEAMRRGCTGYTAVDGIPELKEAVRAKFARDNGLEFSPEQINVSPGGKAVIYNAFRATLDPGDEVVIPAPYWVSYPEMARLCGARPVVVAAGPERGYKVAPDRLDAAIGPACKWVVLNSPGNPTGAGYARQELEELAAVLMRHPQVRILSDDIYEHLVYDDFRFATIAAVEPALARRTLTMNGVSKAYAMTGWRIGYAGGEQALVKAMATVMSQTTSNPCTISQWAAVAALSGPQDLLEERRDAFARRRDFVVAALDAMPGLACPVPQGAFYVYPSCAGLIGRTSGGGRVLRNDEDVARSLLEEVGVAVVFGAAFGFSPALRISYALAEEPLREACRRIGDFCARVT